jgi:hypothetical protein
MLTILLSYFCSYVMIVAAQCLRELEAVIEGRWLRRMAYHPLRSQLDLFSVQKKKKTGTKMIMKLYGRLAAASTVRCLKVWILLAMSAALSRFWSLWRRRRCSSFSFLLLSFEWWVALQLLQLLLYCSQICTQKTLWLCDWLTTFCPHQRGMIASYCLKARCICFLLWERLSTLFAVVCTDFEAGTNQSNSPRGLKFSFCPIWQGEKICAGKFEV